MRKISLTLSFVILFFISCSDETTIFEMPEDNLAVESNAEVLFNSVLYENSGVLGIYGETDSSIGTGNSVFREEQAGDYPLTLVAQIATPSFAGADNLTATHVFLDGDYAYISYNTAGSQYAGAADIVFIGDPNTPSLTSRVFSRSIDFNSITFSDGFAYIVGGIDAEQSAVATDNSIILRISAANGRFNLAGLSFGFQEGFNANGVTVANNSIFMTSGRDGFITEFDKNSLEIINATAFTDLRAVVTSNNQRYVLDADLGVRVLNTDLEEVTQIAVNSDFGAADKRTLDVMDNMVVVAEGNNGAGVYNLNSGVFQEHVPITTNPENVIESDIVTNATSFNEDALLMANGGGGLSFSKYENGAISTVGVIELNGSINFVASKGDYIFAASGREGLQIIKLNRPSENLEAACEDSPNYEGSANLNVNGGEELAFSGKKSFNSLNINGSLLLCGSWTSTNDVNINSNGLFAMRGSLFVGRNNSQRAINVGNGATLRIEGSVTVYGDLRLRDGSTLEFIGEDSEISVFGNVEMSNSATVTGTFNDIQNKF